MIDKVKVARSFSRSAATYDQVAYFQCEVGEQLLALLANNGDPGGLCIDLGCGTGHFRDPLLQHFSQCTYLGVDIAEGMLHYCRQHTADQALLCADAEQLPLADNSASLIYTNLAVQWCDQLQQLFAELYRVLQPGGVVALSTLGPQTLFELKQAWSQVDDLVHVNHFSPQNCWRQAILANDFVIEQSLCELQVLRYPRVTDLLGELKLLGAHNVNDGQRQTLTGRQRIQGLLAAYQQFFAGDHYPATYEVLYWVLKKPSA